MNPIPARLASRVKQAEDEAEPDEREPPHRDEVGVGEQVRLAGQPPEQIGERPPRLLQVARGRPRGRRQLGHALVEEVPADEDPQHDVIAIESRGGRAFRLPCPLVLYRP